MKQTATTGTNRTGIASSEGRAAAMQEGMERHAPTSHGSPEAAGRLRLLYARESVDNGRTLGSVPPPDGMGDKAKAVLKKALGDPTLLMDKLGERIAFERTGTRLYQALVSKFDVDDGFVGGPTRQELVNILNEEHEHFVMLCDCMRAMGGDPTAMTPSADLAATASSGLLKVVTDPRTTLLQGLEAILIAELADRDGWLALIALARSLHENEMAEAFERAEYAEDVHLTSVRSWLTAGRGLEPGVGT